MSDVIEIIEHRPELKDYFYKVNHEWVNDMFKVEEVDELVLSNPDKYIINTGGYIWYASHSEHGIVGACALMRTSVGEYELTKMGVLKKARGLKVGEKLLKHVIEFSNNSNHKLLYLLTNKKCESAIYLYLKNNFKHDLSIMNKYGKKYERCDVAMKYIK